MSSFIPEVGALVTCVVISDASSDFSICYRDNPEDELHYRTICRIDDFEARPHFSGQVDTVTTTVDFAGANNVAIHRHFTTWQELRAIPRLWSDRQVKIDDWLEEVNDLDDLPEEQKERVRKALQH